MKRFLNFFQLPDKTKDPLPFYFILAGGLTLLVLGITFVSQSNEVDALGDRHAALSSELTALERTIAENQAERDVEQKASIVEATGLDPALIAIDTVAATDYFASAFNWTNGEEYDIARDGYDASLGKGNSFTETYFPENTKIETSDGTVSYIDFKNIKSMMDDIAIVPTTAEGDRIRYVAFVRYYMHTDSQDLNNLDALAPSEAIIEFTASGDPDAGDRTVSEVEAWAGFSATLE